MRVNVWLGTMAAAVIAFILPGLELGAAGFPERPIQVLVGWPVGSVNDSLDRAIAPPLSKILKQPVIIQNVPGGGGALFLGRVRFEKPDGYTLFQTNQNVFSQIPWQHAVPYDPLKDFAFLAQHSGTEGYLLCRSESPWKSFGELIQYARKNPKKVKFGTAGGVSTAAHMMMEYVAMKENLQWISVPFTGNPELTAALLGGHIDLAAITLATEVEFVKTGRLRPLICFNEKRMGVLPDLPTVVEMGYDFTYNVSYIWSVPAKTPMDIQKILEKALLRAFADPEVREILNKFNKTYDPVDSEATTKAVIKDHKVWGELMKKLGLGIFKK
jgi:tripartite-type tricarboxylate transporter receptor subunit TctC